MILEGAVPAGIMTILCNPAAAQYAATEAAALPVDITVAELSIEAFADNPASLAVTRALGYSPNGDEYQVRRDELAHFLVSA